MIVGGESFEMHFSVTGAHVISLSPLGAVGTQKTSPRLFAGLSFPVDVKEPKDGDEVPVFDLEFDEAQLEAIELCIEEVAEAVREAARKK